MYSSEQVDWWIRQSKMGHFQDAYRNVARYVPTGSNVVDLACGPGEMLKLLYRENPERDLIGTDASDEMLMWSFSNLSAVGAHPLRKTSVEIPVEKGVYIVKDDIMECALPDEMTGTVTITFTHPGKIKEMTKIDRRLITRILAMGTVIAPSEFDAYYSFLRCLYHGARIARIGGYVITTELESHTDERERDSYANGVLAVSKVFGCELDSQEFIDAPKIYDTIARKYNRGVKSMRGYRIAKRRKVRHVSI